MKIVFFGTPDYVLVVLKALHKKYVGRAGKSPIVGVVTQSPKPVGRKQKLEYSAVDRWAHDRGIRTFYSASDIVDAEIEADFGVLAAYGEIIPPRVLTYFPSGILNIHPSLLPKFRGASPVPATILTEELPGASIIKLDELMDHGPIVNQFKDELFAQDTQESLRNRLFERSAKVLLELIDPYLKNKIKPKEQDHSKATFTTLLKKSHGYIKGNFLTAALQGKTAKTSWEIPFIKDYIVLPNPQNLEKFIRAVHPWPGAWTEVQLSQKLNKPRDKKRLKILKAHLEENLLVLDEVQLESKNPVSWFLFKAAYPTATFI